MPRPWALVASSFVLAVPAIGCRDQTIVPLLGKWDGGFVPEGLAQGRTSSIPVERARLNGFLQIYASNRRFILDLRAEQQGIEAKGVWTSDGRRVTLNVTELKVDDGGGERLRNPNKIYIPSEQLKATYERDLVLDLSGDGKVLAGLLVSVGPFLGKHNFVKSEIRQSRPGSTPAEPKK